jgi:hypothetical protein
MGMKGGQEGGGTARHAVLVATWLSCHSHFCCRGWFKRGRAAGRGLTLVPWCLDYRAWRIGHAGKETSAMAGTGKVSYAVDYISG